MSAQLYCSVSTELDREKVWSLFSDIENWHVCSDVYEGLRWEGSAWVTNASIVGRVRLNRNEKIRYVVEKCEPARLVSYVGHSEESGFASHRTIRFVDREEGGTLIEIDYYTMGTPKTAVAGAKFVKWLTERWIYGFARFCREYSESNRPTHPAKSGSESTFDR
jgi:Polyketide cyclase / dehydrase and lipid transport